MITKFKIFEEGNGGPSQLEDSMNEFFLTKDIEINHVNVVIEKVEGVDYKSVIVCYDER